MKVSLKWLKDFVDIDVDLQTLADKMVSVGLEIEEIIDASQVRVDNLGRKLNDVRKK